MRIVFMGSPEFSVPTLRALLDSEHDVVAVYSQPPRAAGRGKKERPTPVHAVAEEAGIPVYTPKNFKDPADIEAFAAHNADMAVVIAYGLILPQALLDAPKHGCVNLHASLLPRWRGAAPIHRAIMAGDKKTGVCLMQMTAGLDEGPVFTQQEVEITADTRTGELHDALADLSAQVLIENIAHIASMETTPQPDESITYAHKIDKSESEIDWSKPAQEVAAHIHGLSPFPGAWSSYQNERIKFHHVEIAQQNGTAGAILDEAFTIACGQGAIKPIILQREGKKAMQADDVLRGLKFNIGDQIGSRS